MDIKVNFSNLKDKSYFTIKTLVPFDIDNEEYDIEVYFDVIKDSNTGEFVMEDVWIEDFYDAPVFEINDELKEELYDVLSYIISNYDSTASENLYEKKFSTEEREKLAKTGEALPDGSYPIRNKRDLINAIKSQGRGLRNATPKRVREVLNHIKKRANELGVKLEKTEKGYWSIVNENNFDTYPGPPVVNKTSNFLVAGASDGSIGGSGYIYGMSGAMGGEFPKNYEPSTPYPDRFRQKIKNIRTKESTKRKNAIKKLNKLDVITSFDKFIEEK